MLAKARDALDDALLLRASSLNDLARTITEKMHNYTKEKDW